MSATLRIHRGFASADRVVMLGSTALGPLSQEVNDFAIPEGRHVVSLKLGRYNSVATGVTVKDGDLVELKTVENPDAILPILQGGFLRLDRLH